MRPHEEEWERHPSTAGEWIQTKQGLIIATMGDPRRRQLAESAPDMARALKAFLSDHGHTPDCGYSGYGDHQCSTECAAARAALAKGGAL